MASLDIFNHTAPLEVDGELVTEEGSVVPIQFPFAHVWVGYPNSIGDSGTYAVLEFADRSVYRWTGDPLEVDIDTDIDPATEPRWEAQ